MASQLYSRYVPPKNKSNNSSAGNSNGNLESPSSASSPATKTALPSTRKDASSTYSRYVPAGSKSKSRVKNEVTRNTNKEDTESPPKRTFREEETTNDYHQTRSKKQRLESENTVEARVTTVNQKSLPDQTDSQGDLATPLSQDDSVEHVSPKKKEGRKKKKPVEEEKPQGEVEETEELDLKHKSVLKRRDKSLKRAEKVSRKTAAKEAEEDNRDEEQFPPQEAEEIHPLAPLPQPEPINEDLGDPTFSALPSWLSSPIRISPKSRSPFSKFGISQDVVDNLNKLGFKDAFAIQTAVLPLLLPGDQNSKGDVLVSAATGSGKTLSYVLPMVEEISRTIVTRLQGLIIMPTRELVRQAREVCDNCATAYAGIDKRRQIHIGVAVGNQTLKVEQASIINQFKKVDPERYRELRDQDRSKWDVSNDKPEPDFRFDEDDSLSTLIDHVAEYRSKVDVLICTPGRLVEHIKSTPGFTLDYLKWLVIDEADKLLDQSFQQWLDVVTDSLASKEHRELSKLTDGIRPISLRKVVLSATMTRDLGQLSSLRLNAPRLVILEGSEESQRDLDKAIDHGEALSLPSTLEESAVKVEDSNDKPLYLLEILKRNLPKKLFSQLARDQAEEDLTSTSDESSEDDSSDEDDSDVNESESSDEISSPSSSGEPSIEKQSDVESGKSSTSRGILVFTKSNENAVRLSRLLILIDPRLSDLVGTLTSTVRHSVRKSTLREFLAGRVSVLIASDLVARGLDLPNLAHVINYDMPTSLTSYVHRVGRTARAGKFGQAWTLFTPTEGRWFWQEIARSNTVQRTAGKKVGRVNISGEIFGADLREKYETALKTLGEEAGAK